MIRRVGVLLLFMLLASGYAKQTPVFEASDEAEHFLYLHHINQYNELPVIQTRDALDATASVIARWNNHSHHPPLYYLVGAQIIAPLQMTNLQDYLVVNPLIFLRNARTPYKWLHMPQPGSGDTATAVFFLRLLNTAFGLMTLCLVYRIARQFLPPLPSLVSMALAAVVPIFVSISASVTNDALLILLYSAGILWAVQTVQGKPLSAWRVLLICLITAAAALIKLTGLSLLGIIGIGLLIAWWQQQITWRAVIGVGLALIVSITVLAGWWYIRNWQLYGDPFALAATQAIWGRTVSQQLPLIEELQRFVRSLWLMLGYSHAPVYLPRWMYVPVFMLFGLSVPGLALYSWRYPHHRSGLGLLMWTTCVVVLTVFAGTQTVDISYGRLLLPGISAGVVLVAAGWWWLLKRLSIVPVLLLSLTTLYAPLVILPAAYPALSSVDTIPAAAMRINAAVDDLEIVAIGGLDQPAYSATDWQLDIYLTGSHPHNPALFITMVDPLRQQDLSHVEVYPGMAPTHALSSDAVYHAVVTLPVKILRDDPLPRHQLELIIEWYSPVTEDTLTIDSNTSRLRLPGPSLNR